MHVLVILLANLMTVVIKFANPVTINGLNYLEYNKFLVLNAQILQQIALVVMILILKDI